MPGKPGLPRQVTLPASHVAFDSASRCSSISGPKSNSWLPRTAKSNPMALASAIMCAPLSTPDSSDGEIMSPPKVTIARCPAARARARSSRTTVAILAAPPRPFIPSIRSQSLTWTRVTDTGSARPDTAGAQAITPAHTRRTSNRSQPVMTNDPLLAVSASRDWRAHGIRYFGSAQAAGEDLHAAVPRTTRPRGPGRGGNGAGVAVASAPAHEPCPQSVPHAQRHPVRGGHALPGIEPARRMRSRPSYRLTLRSSAG